MLLEIGEVYEFNYKSERRSSVYKEPVIIQLNEKTIANAVMHFNTVKKELIKKFEKQTKKLNPYINLLKEKEVIAKERGRGHKKEKELLLEQKISELKISHFGHAEGKQLTDEEKARGLVLRNYTVSKLDFEAAEKPFKTLYIGDKFTPNGKIVSSFYSLIPTTIERSRLTPESGLFVDIL